MKSKLTTLLLCLFFGMFGAHRFYVGKIGTGILYLCTGGLFCIGFIVDLLSIILNEFRDGNGCKLKDDMTSSASFVDMSSSSKTECKREGCQTECQKECRYYIPITIKQLYNELDKNALRAKRMYQNNYVAINGKLKTIDSNGEYIVVFDSNNNCSFRGLCCFIKNKYQINKIMELNKEDDITVYCQIISVDEVLGYKADIVYIK